ncbi:septal ring lytic transglycosylase RlpA family protein [Elizabethkingia argentiflava]|uniref:Probable endolytic peptidoglycan transglycosylase RlpA n=1 Tax=Elizabethkingia argenteiflava TaxID=2681556 RepID=A0A845PVM4_9FLAO|nr:septal ring lytic transglycosylase RlpA family protein [Elizabethkingia argenteiflava]NAW50160.1 septal ring lytic transglycosylase RlpA family protein [Elizabethkingia argenteiflava]
MSRPLFLLAVLPALACSLVKDKQAAKEKLTKVSYYSDSFNGRKTSNGEIFDNNKFTAAHVSLPFGSKVLLTNVSTGDTVTVKVNDRGPLHRGRGFDITKAAFKKLGDLRIGIMQVSYQIIEE